MDETRAAQIAEILGGEAWQSGGDIWLVVIRRNDGHLVVVSDEVICEYENEDAFENSQTINSILMS